MNTPVTKHSVTELVSGRCLTCGQNTDDAETGRPREYCSDACRQSGYRLRRREGPDWWQSRPWHAAAALADQERRERTAQERAERAAAEQRRAEWLSAMPPQVRAGVLQAEQAKLAAKSELFNRAHARLQRQERALNLRFMQAIGTQPRTLGKVALLDPVDDERMEKLLNRAVVTDSDDEAAACLVKARSLWRSANPGVLEGIRDSESRLTATGSEVAQ